jgi:hypothetical protein
MNPSDSAVMSFHLKEGQERHLLVYTSRRTKDEPLLSGVPLEDRTPLWFSMQEALEDTGLILEARQSNDVNIHFTSYNDITSTRGLGLPAIVSLLTALGSIPEGSRDLGLTDYAIIGDVGPRGGVWSVPGTQAKEAATILYRERLRRLLMVPEANIQDALVPGVRVLGVKYVRQVVEFFRNYKPLRLYPDNVLVYASDTRLNRPYPYQTPGDALNAETDSWEVSSVLQAVARNIDEGEN